MTKHPLRRKIIMLLMLLGNAGIVTAVSSLILSMVGTSDDGVLSSWWFRLLVLVVGITVLWKFAHSDWIDRRLSQFIAWGLRRWTDLEVRDYTGLLHLSSGYAVVELQVTEGDWLANQELASLKLADEGVLVLGVQCANGEYLGAPQGRTALVPGDTVILYGRRDLLEELDQREAGSSGNWDHHKAVDRQRQIEREEEQLEREESRREQPREQPENG